jgi:hypothetical protein
MSTRNRAVGTWETRAYRRYPEQDAHIIVEQADLLTKLNYLYVGGSYRVRLRNVAGMRGKTFYGEYAWSNAARYAGDAASALGDWRWRPDL